MENASSTRNSANLDYVEFGKHVAVSQGEGVTVQVAAIRLGDIGVLVQLIRERCLQVDVQLQKR